MTQKTKNRRREGTHKLKPGLDRVDSNVWLWLQKGITYTHTHMYLHIHTCYIILYYVV